MKNIGIYYITIIGAITHKKIIIINRDENEKKKKCTSSVKNEIMNNIKSWNLTILIIISSIIGIFKILITPMTCIFDSC